ncbi:Aldehyde dehydrogenase family 3 member B1 [Wickerhamiella sorbophila]|uniref:Aldehyde dehydrogenase n=1 Tax=Wickerhamiella sorbophila TaxID=45607 RepID=A0A2T0FHW2_9ASCO|nr:Aldehyde dehydrogenase family 3 member B1 [Wickerhamiella sorbophila]PRT54547.1 Aldehyde dehydrogenase family 3 member B1 [Wickerhamiella sorbophila]
MYTPLEEIQHKHQRVVDSFHKGKAQSLDYRKDQLRNLYFAIKDNQGKLKEALFKDLHRPPHETDVLELFLVYSEINAALSHLSKWSSDTKLSGDKRLLLSGPVLRKSPYGAVLIVSPWNYPYLLSLAPICSAIAAGNTVVFKPTEIAEHSTKALCEVLEATLDPDTFQVVQGGPEQATALLELKWDKIFFTGSTPVGRIVAQAAAKHLTPVTLELGGKSPVIVTKTANLPLAAKRIAWGKFTNAGQTCIAPDYLVLEKPIAEKFLVEFSNAIKALYGADLTKDSPDYAHIVSARLWERQQRLVSETKGTISLQHGTPDAESLFFPPTIVTGVSSDDVLMGDELFGPILPVMTIDNMKEAPKLIQKHDYPLALYLFSTDSTEQENLLRNTRSGAAIVNDTLIQGGSSAVPFGGVGTSGTGRYHGKFGFDEFTHERPILYQSELAEMAMSLRYPPLTESKMKKLRFVSLPREWFSRTGPVRGLAGRLWG